MKDSALEQVRASAAGVERDYELEAQFPIKERYEITVPHGDTGVHVFICEPENRDSVTPLIVNMHGGGFVKGYRGRDYAFTANLACNSGCLVADVDYIPAPECRYPGAIEQGYAVIRYFAEHHEEYRIDPERIILSGQSAGANMITAIALLNKERRDFSIRQMILAYPPLDLVTDPVAKPLNDTPEARAISERGRLYNDWYVDEELRSDIHVSPVYATEEELRDLPPFVIMTGGQDSLGAEGELFAYHLIRAGVPVIARRFMNSKHGFLVRRVGDCAEAENLMFSTIAGICTEK